MSAIDGIAVTNWRADVRARSVVQRREQRQPSIPGQWAEVQDSDDGPGNPRGPVSCPGGIRSVARQISRDGRNNPADRGHRAACRRSQADLGTIENRLGRSSIGTPLFAQVNREFCQRLIARGHVSVRNLLIGDRRPRAAPVAAFVLAAAGRGHWVIVQPWEFGSLPRSWIGPMTSEVDEVWAYTRLRQGLLRHERRPPGPGPCRAAGGRSSTVPSRSRALPARDREAIPIPLRRGDDPPQGHRRPAGRRTPRPSPRRDPVCLVIKDMGGTSFYRGQTAEERIGQIRSQPSRPGDRVPRPGARASTSWPASTRPATAWCIPIAAKASACRSPRRWPAACP